MAVDEFYGWGKHVKDWFDAHGATLDDARSFRRQIDVLENEIAAETILVDATQHTPDNADIYAQSKVIVANLRDLKTKLEARLAEILKPTEHL